MPHQTPSDDTLADALVAAWEATDSLDGLGPRLSRAQVAARTGISEKSIARIEQTFSARLAARLLSADTHLPPHLARQIARHLNP